MGCRSWSKIGINFYFKNIFAGVEKYSKPQLRLLHYIVHKVEEFWVFDYRKVKKLFSAQGNSSETPFILQTFTKKNLGQKRMIKNTVIVTFEEFGSAPNSKLLNQ